MNQHGDEFLLFRLLYPRDDPGRGKGAGAEVCPRHGQAPRPPPQHAPRQVDRRVRRHRGEIFEPFKLKVFPPPSICRRHLVGLEGEKGGPLPSWVLVGWVFAAQVLVLSTPFDNPGGIVV